MRDFRKSFVLKMIFVLCVGMVGVGLSLRPAAAKTFKVLHSFCAQADCGEGYLPNGGLLRDQAGNLFGTTWYGGLTGFGVAYELERASGGDHWTYRVLHTFCEKKGCADGGESNSGFISDTAGNLYGVTVIGGIGGTYGAGTVFELIPNASHKKWSMHLLYKFCSLQDCHDGHGPQLGLTYAGKAQGQLYNGHSALYGVTGLGGRHNKGTVFELKPSDGGGWTERVIYDFCRRGLPCIDGSNPQSMLTMDTFGNLYGTTPEGGAYSKGREFRGVLFELSHDAGGKNWTETVLHSFGCAGQPCTNGGRFPGSHPLLAVDGNFYGVTESSGRDCTVTPEGRCGTLYKIVPDGVGSQWSVLHRFCKQANCDDGSIPRDGLAADVFGNFYGVTDYGGGGLDMNSHGGGTIFKFDGSLHILHRFCAQANCRDGEYPFTAPIIDSTGNLFGATSYGGAGGEGVIYELTP